jgi:hypothetical protein
MAKRRITQIPVPPSDPGPPGAKTARGHLPLTEDEQRFINEWQIDYNPHHAFARAFPNMPARVVNTRAQELCRRPHVREEMRAIRRANRVHKRVSSELALDEMACIAFSDIYQLFDPVTNQLRTARQIPPETRKAIQSVRVNRSRSVTTTNGSSRTTVTDSVIEYKFWPKVDALKMVTNYLGLNTSLPPLETLLAALPRTLADAIRTELRRKEMGLPDEGQSSSVPTPTPPPQV